MALKKLVCVLLTVCLAALNAAALADVTIGYDLNGGTGNFETRIVQPDASGLIQFRHPARAPRRAGYRFLGWLCGNDPLNYPLDPAGKAVSFAMSEGALNYTAQWMPDDHPAFAPYMTVTTLNPDGTVYDVLEGQFKCVQKSEATYYCMHNWYNASGDFSGIVDGSGYAGFQYGDGKTWLILSIWGNEHGSPTIEYCRPGSIAEPFGGEGEGMHVRTEYPWQEFVWYTMRIQAWSDSRKTYYEQWVKAEGDEWEKYAVISYPIPGLGFTWDCFFLEDWIANNLPRSCQLRGYYARRQRDCQWQSLTRYEIDNHIAGTRYASVRFDCDYNHYGPGAAWIQSGGDGYDAKTSAMPGVLEIAQAKKPEEPGFLRY